MPGVDDNSLPAAFSHVETLSRGAVTTVVRVRSREYGDVVLKRWNQPLSQASELRDFQREAHLHESLSPDAAPHPNIVAFVAAAGEDEQPPWIATRPGGPSLAQVLTRRVLSRDEALRISADILDGLAMMHARHLVHGDLTPRNVLVYNGRAALCDLGLAGRRGELRASPQIGTPEYMAPELIAHPDRAPDARTDVYAASLLIAELLGDLELPWKAEHLVYTRAQSARSSDRPVDAVEFAHAFRDVLGTTRPGLPRGGRGWGVRAALLLVPLLACLGALGWWWQGRASTAMTSPMNGAYISPIAARGRSPIAENETVLLIQRTGMRPFELRAEPATIEPDQGGWDATVDVGSGPCDEGLTFDLWAMALAENTSEAKAAADAYAHGLFAIDLDALPTSGRVLGHARVTMTKFQGHLNRCPGVSQELTSTPLE